MNEPDWSCIRHFEPNEFPAGVIKKMSPAFFCHLDTFRSLLNQKVFPSPLKAGWIRTTGKKTSRHYVDRNKKSDAGDVFPENVDPFYALITALDAGFKGIGLYFDTKYKGKPAMMMHLDLREGPTVIWVRDESGYTTIYPRPNQDLFKLLLKHSNL